MMITRRDAPPQFLCIASVCLWPLLKTKETQGDEDGEQMCLGCHGVVYGCDAIG